MAGVRARRPFMTPPGATFSSTSLKSREWQSAQESCLTLEDSEIIHESSVIAELYDEVSSTRPGAGALPALQQAQSASKFCGCVLQVLTCVQRIVDGIPHTAATLVVLVSHFCCTMYLGREGFFSHFSRMTVNVHTLTAIVNVLCANMHGKDEWKSVRLLMDMCAKHWGLPDSWRLSSAKYCGALCVLWCCGTIVSCVGLGVGPAKISAETALTCLTTTFASGILTVLTCAQVHVLCAVDLMLDDFLGRFACDGDAKLGIIRWRQLNVLLCKAARAFSTVFFSMQVGVAATIFLRVVQAVQADDMQQGLVTRTFFNELPAIVEVLVLTHKVLKVAGKVLGGTGVTSTFPKGTGANDEREALLYQMRKSLARIEAERAHTFITGTVGDLAGMALCIFCALVLQRHV